MARPLSTSAWTRLKIGGADEPRVLRAENTGIDQVGDLVQQAMLRDHVGRVRGALEDDQLRSQAWGNWPNCHEPVKN